VIALAFIESLVGLVTDPVMLVALVASLLGLLLEELS
jgi:hypothetical protein